VRSIRCILWQLNPQHLCELRLHGYCKNHSALKELKRLSGLKVLHFTLDWLRCTLDCVNATLDALPLLRDFGLNASFISFTPQQGDAFALHCSKLTSLAVCNIYTRPCYFMTMIAPNLQGLQSLDANYSSVLEAEDVRALAQNCGGLHRLSFGGALRATANLAAVMDKFPLLQYLDLSYMYPCNTAPSCRSCILMDAALIRSRTLRYWH
jgi:hypothetical protein